MFVREQVGSVVYKKNNQSYLLSNEYMQRNVNPDK